MNKTARFFILFVVISVLGALPLAAMAGEARVIEEAVFGPGTKTVTFDLPGAPDSISLTVLNGAEKGQTRASSAVVELNGKTLYRQKDFNQNVSTLSTTIPREELTGTGNRLTVMVNGRPAAFLKVTLTGDYPAPPPPPPPPPAPAKVAWYIDNDKDGYGAGNPIMMPAGVPPPPGSLTLVLVNGDCNDFDPMIYPGNGCP
jgi:hypothetical protein